VEYEVNKPSYISLHISGELENRAARLNHRLETCDICPRKCSVNRSSGEMGYCNSGKNPIVASFCDHHGEEPVISGIQGSGAIFFGNCNLACVYCQNYQISQNSQGQINNQITVKELADCMIGLQKTGCHNINLVSPSHVVAQVVSALNLAAKTGLTLPLVYNTNSYDSPDTLAEMDGIISIYLPDIKYSDNEMARRYSGATNYVEHTRQAIQEMYRQVGGLVVDKQGVAVAGVLVRHLVLPNGIAGSQESLEWLAEKIGTDVGLSLMSQYYPCHRAGQYQEIARPVTRQEYLYVLKLAQKLGFKRIFAQQLQSNMHFLPDFDCKNPFGN
jgi:putative pyruvate formate lyase activating enzyme